MTSRERLLSAIRCETPDRVPIGPFELGRLDRSSDFTREFIKTVDPLLDPGAGANLMWGDAVPQEHIEEEYQTTTILHTPMGDLRRVVRRTSITSAQTEFYCSTPEDAEKILSLPYKTPKIDISHYEKRRAEIGEEGLVIMGVPDAICWPADLYSPEDFALLWVDAPDVMRKLVSTAADRVNAGVEKLAPLVDGFRIIGGEYASTQLGPQGFAELVVEQDAELCDIMRRNDAVSYYHNHGPVTRFYDMFVQVGMDALDPLEAPPWGDCDLVEAKEKLASKVCIVGNLDDMEVIDKLPWEEVEPIARERLSITGPDGFILGGTASGTYTEAGARNFMKMVPLAEEMAGRWV
jgi:uroporphyrinogen decarboxylase